MPDLRTTWDQLTNVAIAGVGRQELPPLAADDAIGKFCAGIAAEEKAARFLNVAGAMALCRQAGAQSAADAGAPPEPAPPERLPCCSPPAARLLRLALAEAHLQRTLPEWAALAARHGQVVSPELLPAVLQAMKESRALRPAFLPVIGERGRWLAHLHPEWRAGIDPNTEENYADVWETGSRAERTAALRTMRRLDPAAARAALEEARVSEPLETLAAFIAALEVKLSPDDEPLLESLLADKRKTIRRPAAELLATLAGSAYQQRMAARAGRWVAITPAQSASLFPPRMKQPVKVEVTLPGSFDPDWARDGLEETPPQSTGAKSWWLRQIIAAVPLSWWEQAGNCGPDDLLTATKGSEHRQLLLYGWMLAAQRQHNVPWVIALLRLGDISVTQGLAGDAYVALTTSEREQVLAGVLADGGQHLREITHTLLQLTTDPWNPALSAQVAAFPVDSRMRTLFEHLAYYLHPRDLPKCRARVHQTQQYYPHADARALAVMQFREDLYHTFEERL